MGVHEYVQGPNSKPRSTTCALKDAEILLSSVKASIDRKARVVRISDLALLANKENNPGYSPTSNKMSRGSSRRPVSFPNFPFLLTCWLLCPLAFDSSSASFANVGGVASFILRFLRDVAGFDAVCFELMVVVTVQFREERGGKQQATTYFKYLSESKEGVTCTCFNFCSLTFE